MSQVLQCPKCRQETLRRVDGYTAAGDLTARPARCSRCDGLWLTREELERIEREPGAAELVVGSQGDGDADERGAGTRPVPEKVGEGDPSAPDDTARELSRVAEPPDEADSRGGLCPDCHRILVRADVELERIFYLERCAHCGGIWFDSGEWSHLAEHDRLEDLSRLWDPVYRRERLEEQNRKAYLERLRVQLGEELMSRIESVAADLDGHDHKALAVAYLFERLDIPRPELDDDRPAGESASEPLA